MSHIRDNKSLIKPNIMMRYLKKLLAYFGWAFEPLKGASHAAKPPEPGVDELDDRYDPEADIGVC